MMEEGLEQPSLTELRELVKECGLHGVTGLRKQEPAERLTALSYTRVQQAVVELPDSLRDAADGGTFASGLLETVSEGGFGLLRSASYLPGEEDVHVLPSQMRRFRLRTGDLVIGVKHLCGERERYSALLYVNTVNGACAVELRRANLEDMTPVFPDKRIPLVTGDKSSLALRVVDLIVPIGKGQRGLIAALPKVGKTTLPKEIAKTIRKNAPEIHLIVFLTNERPEEVTDIKGYIADPEVEVTYSTFDREPEQYRRVSEMAIERTCRIIEQHGDAMILLDSITRLVCAYNLTVTPSGHTFSGGLDPASLYMSKHFFGAARNIREGGSLTILATALVETGSRMDDVIYEELKDTGNMELMLDCRLAKRRTLPAIDVARSGTKREELPLSVAEKEGVARLRNLRGGGTNEMQIEAFLGLFRESADNHALLGRLADSKQELFPGLQRQRKRAIL